jgi:adenylate cyclase
LLLSEFDLAFDLLEEWLPKLGEDQIESFKRDLDLDPIRSHPRYAALLALTSMK